MGVQLGVLKSHKDGEQQAIDFACEKASFEAQKSRIQKIRQKALDKTLELSDIRKEKIVDYKPDKWEQVEEKGWL